MTDYLSIREAAEQWGVSERRVNQFCADGRIEGARKIGGSWVIPADAKKPSDPRKQKKQAEEMRAKLKVGATVTTIGGIVGEVIKIDDQYIYIVTGTEESPNTMKFVRQAIHSINEPKSETTSTDGGEEEIVDEIK